MSAKLVYHTPESAAGGVSPFDTTILEMVEHQDLRIACPYLSLRYLRRIVNRSASWRLLTDVRGWLASHMQAKRDDVVQFILLHHTNIHHCRSLHAKLIVTDAQALIGSANFTQMGMTGRVEMSVLSDDAACVEEALAWFDALWSATDSVSEHDLRAVMASLPSPTPLIEHIDFPSRFPGVSSKLASMGGSSASPSDMSVVEVATKRNRGRRFVAPEMSQAAPHRDFACILACLSTSERKTMAQLVREANELAKSKGFDKYSVEIRTRGRNRKYEYLRHDRYFDYLTARYHNGDVIRDGLVVMKYSEQENVTWSLAPKQ